MKTSAQYITVNILFLLFLQIDLYAQGLDVTPTPVYQMREVGFALQKQFSPGFIYKKQIKENVYRRFNLNYVVFNQSYSTQLINYNFSNGSYIHDKEFRNSFNLLFSLQFGREKRHQLWGKLIFIHGFNFIVSPGTFFTVFKNYRYSSWSNQYYNSQGKHFTTIIETGPMYLLGILYPVHKNLMLGLEYLPTALFTFNTQLKSNPGIAMSLDVTRINYTIAYRFQSKGKSK